VPGFAAPTTIERTKSQVSEPRVPVKVSDDAMGRARMLIDSGVRGAILPDLPLDESAGWEADAAAAGVETVLLAAPVTPDERLAELCRRAHGFVYGVNLMGVTGERTTLAVPASGRVLRRGLMQGGQESRQGVGCLGIASRRDAVSRFTGDPGSDNPSARESLGRLAETLRNRYLQWEARRYGGQQGVLLEEQLVCALSGPGQPDRKVVAEPPQLIVPATRTKCQRQVGQVGVLFAEQLCNQIRGDLIFSVRHKSNRRSIIENRPLVRPIGVRQAHQTSRC